MSGQAPFCVDFDEDLSALLDGELDDVRARSVQAHVAECATCAARLVAFAQASAALQGERARPYSGAAALPALRVLRSGAASTHRARRLPRRARYAMSLGLAAAAALVLVLRLRPSVLPLASPVAPTPIAREEAATAREDARLAQKEVASGFAPVTPAAPTPKRVAESTAPALEASADLLDSASDDELAIAEELDTAADLDLIEQLELLEALAAREAS